jgi:hypothetical protein
MTVREILAKIFSRDESRIWPLKLRYPEAALPPGFSGGPGRVGIKVVQGRGARGS